VLSDALMPGMDGFDVAQEIVRDDQVSGTVIMMLSSGDRPGDVAICERLGVAAYLIKPIKQSELFDAIMLALGITLSAEPAVAAATRQVELPSLRILLAEDSAVNQKLACVLLARHGHQVEIANDGRETVDKLKTRQFDLVLMDVQMPVMDGLDATKIIRARERSTGRYLPTVALTAHAM
jgi:two-component system sensor histidine kinase/response regulator